MLLEPIPVAGVRHRDSSWEAVGQASHIDQALVVGPLRLEIQARLQAVCESGKCRERPISVGALHQLGTDHNGWRHRREKEIQQIGKPLVHNVRRLDVLQEIFHRLSQAWVGESSLSCHSSK
jgi:hypothetical protein